jgi:hypothetical protein
MRQRALHLAGLLLLLASLGAAESPNLRDTPTSIGAHFIGILLAQQQADAAATIASNETPGEPLILNLPAAAAVHLNNPWTMRPPSAQTLSVHAVTGSSL